MMPVNPFNPIIKFFKKIKPALFHRYTLFLLSSAILYLIIIIHLSKYKTELISTTVSSEDYSYRYADLDQDGSSEKLQFVLNYHDLYGLIIYHQDKTIGQWNFTGNGAKGNSHMIDDVDHDGIREILVFTVHHDSIFLNCLDAINRNIEFQNKPICKVNKDAGGEYDYEIIPCSCFDVNKDGYKEVFFSIRSGFSTFPRNMFAYYPGKDSVFVSPESCSLILEPEMMDMDGDSIPEFMARITHATGNCDTDRNYSDQYTWLMVFTPDMKFKFPPISFDAHPSVTRFIPVKNGKTNQILVMHIYQGLDNNPSFFALYNDDGKLIRKKNIDMPESWVYSALFAMDDEFEKIRILKTDGRVLSIDSMLNLTYRTKLKNNPNILGIDKMDLDLDGQKEFIFPGKANGEMMIYRNDFSNPVALNTGKYISSDRISLISKTGELPGIFIYNNEYLFIFSYKLSLLYKYRFILLLPIFLIILFTDLTIRQIRKYKKLKVDHIQKQLSELQIKSIQNQLDPHFTFNIFSSFSNLINEKDTKRANYIFDKYAGLLKTSVINSANVQVSLREELDFVTSYLELEKFRYSDQFSFQINIQENISDQIAIPKMIVHIFVENAIKHGIRHLNSGGRLIINGTQNNGTIKISIHDNGVGRAKAKEIGSTSTGKGLMIVNAIIENYNKLYNQKIGFKINDLYENELATGTEVQIRIPVPV